MHKAGDHGLFTNLAMPRGVPAGHRRVCAPIQKREIFLNSSAQQILNLTSIYNTAETVIKSEPLDPFIKSEPLDDFADIVQQGGFTPNGLCFSPVAEAKSIADRPQVKMQHCNIKWKAALEFAVWQKWVGFPQAA